MVIERVKHYRIKQKIGSGGMATVYEAIDEHTGTTVALKILHPHLADQPTYVERFSREAQVAMNLHSPHIARVLDSGRDKVDGDTVYYIAMEYIPGVTLTQLMQNEGIFSVAQVMNIAYQVAQALAEANRHGIVHRDIKPQNIMITPEGVVKVMDFGIARESVADSLTKTGVFVGTPQYSSPEQALGKKDVDIRSDIYSLGVVLYQLLTGTVPFQADTPQALLNRIVQGNPVPVESHRVDLPSEVSAIVNKMLRREPRNRFQSPKKLVDALRPLVESPMESGEMATIVAPQSRGTNPHVVSPVVAGSLILGLLAMTIVAAALSGKLFVGKRIPTPVVTSSGKQIANSTTGEPETNIPTTQTPIPTSTQTTIPTLTPTLTPTPMPTSTPTLAPTPTATPTPRPPLSSKIKRAWNRSRKRALFGYHPFVLTSLAYDDSTINKWKGIGFLVFLIRLILAVIAFVVDIILTIVIGAGVLVGCLFGATVQNIFYGVLALSTLILIVMELSED